MEGGYLPWKLQTLKEKVPKLDTYGKPLPPPPHGYFWEKLEDHSWVLTHISDKAALLQEKEKKIIFDKPSVLEHVVMDEDNLPGLCLRYNVSAVNIRRANCFSGNSIKAFRVLRIPIEPGVAVKLQENTQDVLVRKFQNISNEGKIEARIYLEDSNWDLNKALALWSGDESWMSDNNVIPEGFSGMDESNHVRPGKVVIPEARATPTSVAIGHVVSPQNIQYVTHVPAAVAYNSERSRGLGVIPAWNVRDPEAERLLGNF